MTRRTLLVSAAIAGVGLALAFVTLRDGALRRSVPRAAALRRRGGGVREAEALARLSAIPFYRALAGSDGLRSATLDRDGNVHVDLDVRVIAQARMKALGLASFAELLPESAQGTIGGFGAAGAAASTPIVESWLFPGPAPILDVLDRAPREAATSVSDSLPGSPSAVVRASLLPGFLSDPEWGGAPLAAWRDRAEFAEKLLGRPVRRECAEDLLGPAVFALYETANGTEAEAVAVLALRRADRVASLLETLFGLGALTDRATIARYRGVATGSFVSSSGGPGLALAVDGNVLLVATSRARLESAIDARRSGPGRDGDAPASGDAAASWSAVSTSAFVANGWCRLARCPGETGPARATSATLRPVGRSDWRLEGRGAGPAIAADPVVPFLRSFLEKRQRDGG